MLDGVAGHAAGAAAALAVTSNLDINFLRKTPRARLTARAELLKLGRRLALTDVRISTDAHDDLVAQATVTYAIPAGGCEPGGQAHWEVEDLQGRTRTYPPGPEDDEPQYDEDEEQDDESEA